MRPARAKQGLLAVAVLAGVGAASLLDGKASDLVAGGDGDWFIGRPAAAPALVATAAPRSEDLCAARPIAPYLATASPRISTASAPVFQLAASKPIRARSLAAGEPWSPRAPPRG